MSFQLYNPVFKTAHDVVANIIAGENVRYYSIMGTVVVKSIIQYKNLGYLYLDEWEYYRVVGGMEEELKLYIEMEKL
jgi:hypothetical protein